MFATIFEARPKATRHLRSVDGRRDLWPGAGCVDGLIESIEFKSLTRQGWTTSVSTWRDEKDYRRCFDVARHRFGPEGVADGTHADYRLRTGLVSGDRGPGHTGEPDHRTSQAEAGSSGTVVLVNGEADTEWAEACVTDTARWLGLEADAGDVVTWDLLEGIAEPSKLMLVVAFRHDAAARAFTIRLATRGQLRTLSIQLVGDLELNDGSAPGR